MRMRTFMTTAALLALSNSPGLAGPTIHKDVLGSWCYSGTVVKGEFQYSEKFNKDCDDPINTMTVHPTRYEGWEHSCRFTAVKTWFDPNIIANTKTWGVKVSRIESSCEGIDCTWKEQLTIYVTKETFIVKNPRQYQERCH